MNMFEILGMLVIDRMSFQVYSRGNTRSSVRVTFLFTRVAMDEFSDLRLKLPFVSSETASKRRKEQDIISTLVNVYGSQELFVSEYRTLLADRLLSPSTNTIGSVTSAASTSG